MKKLLLAALVTMVACGPVPKPPTPKPPPVRTVAIVVPGGAAGTAYVDDTPSGQNCTLVNGYCEVLIHVATQVSYLTVTAPGYLPYRYDNLGLGTHNIQVWLANASEYTCLPNVGYDCTQVDPLIEEFHPLPRLVTHNWHWSLETGEHFTAIETSDFDLYRQYLQGIDIRPVLQQRHDLGFNMLRVFGSFNGVLGRLVPQDYGTAYYSKLPAFMNLCARYGMYVEFTVFADTTKWAPDIPTQVSHYNMVIMTLADRTNVLIEAVNEGDQPINRTDSLPQLVMPTTLNSSHGSGGSNGWGVDPFWHYTSIHTNLEPEWQRKVGHNCYEIGWLVPAPGGWRGPCLANENKRPDQDPGQPQHFFDAAAGAALLSAGSCYHSQQGKASVLFTGPDLDMAKQWVAGAKSVDLACQDGPYTHRQDLEGPNVLRAYDRPTLGHSCVVQIRK